MIQLPEMKTADSAHMGIAKCHQDLSTFPISWAALQFQYNTGVATMSSLETDMSSMYEGAEDMRLTESGNTRSEQVLVMPTEQLTD